MKKICLFLIIGLFTLINYSCNQSPEPQLKDQSYEIPNRISYTTNTQFNFHQDTLYLGTQKYNGYLIDTFKTGDTANFVGYFNGLEQGIAKKWYPNKQIAEIRFYHQGKKTGIHKGFWENGNPKFEYHFIEGEHHGLAKDWYENGQAYKEFHYKMGYEDGSQKAWWENGQIRANYVVKNGRRYGLIGLKLCMNPEDSLKTKKP